MRARVGFGGLVVGTVAWLALAGGAQEPAPAAGIAWRTDLAAARAEAAAAGKPLFLVFRCET